MREEEEGGRKKKRERREEKTEGRQIQERWGRTHPFIRKSLLW
jgi:hypothetical protein